MESQCINLDINCEVCDSNEFSEHESGFYVCVVCGIFTQIRYGMGLDYSDIHKSTMILKRQIVKEEDINTLYNDTITTTMVNTRAGSEFGDSISTKISKGSGIKSVRSINEIMIDFQNIYMNLFKYICYIEYIELNKIENAEVLLKDNFFNLFESSKYFQEILKIAKYEWKKLVIQKIGVKKLKSKKSYNRSRRATEEIRDNVNINNNINNHCQNFSNIYNIKQLSTEDLLKIKKLKKFNIKQISDFKERKLKDMEKIKLFLEEYDQVKIHIKKNEEIIKKELRLSFEESLYFKNIILIAQNIFNLEINKQYSFEDIIHLIFVKCGLNLKSVFKEEIHYEEYKNHFMSDDFVLIFYSIFNQMSKFYAKENSEYNYTSVFTIGKCIFLFKNFYSNNKICLGYRKYLKFTKKDKISKLIEISNKLISNNYSRIKAIINFICEKMIHLPKYISEICYKLCLISNQKIEEANFKNNCCTEYFIVGIIVYILKLFYGLNDLPYLILLIENKENSNFTNLKNYFKTQTSDEYNLFNYYRKLPTILKVLKTLVLEIINDENTKILWEIGDFKKYLSSIYQEKLFDVKIDNFSHIENNFSTNNIYSLEKKINITVNKLEINKNEKSYINKSQKFLNKTKNQNHSKLNSFLIEEIEHNSKLKNIKKSEIPLPCDTFLRFNKKAIKFDKIKFSTTEILIFYLTSKIFKLDYKELKKSFNIL